jgi:hypothetical protein
VHRQQKLIAVSKSSSSNSINEVAVVRNGSTSGSRSSSNSTSKYYL